MTVTPDKTARAARAVEALVARHAELQGALEHWAGVLAATAVSCGPVRPARNLLRAFLADEVLPHARAEVRTLYRAARRDPGASLLVQLLISEHRDLASRAARLGEPAQPAASAAQAAAISALRPACRPGGRRLGGRLPPQTPSDHAPARDGPAGRAEREQPTRWPSLTTAPHFSQARHAQQAGSPPSPASPDSAASVTARRGSLAGFAPSP